MDHKTFHLTINIFTVSAMLVCSSASTVLAEQVKSIATPTENSLCPLMGWSEGLPRYLAPDAQFPTQEPTEDCVFHQWSWEAFVWATALDSNGIPRFMTLNTPDELPPPTLALKPGAVRPLKLGMRSLIPHVLALRLK